MEVINFWTSTLNSPNRCNSLTNPDGRFIFTKIPAGFQTPAWVGSSLLDHVAWNFEKQFNFNLMTHISSTCQNEFNFEEEVDLDTTAFELYLASQVAMTEVRKLWSQQFDICRKGIPGAMNVSFTYWQSCPVLVSSILMNSLQWNVIIHQSMFTATK